MARIKIKDLDVDLEELKKKDPEILKKIRGGAIIGTMITMLCHARASYSPTLDFSCQVSAQPHAFGFGMKC